MAGPAIDTRVVVPMATDAVRHIGEFERRHDLAHRLHFAVTLLARDVLSNVGLMIEIDEIGKNVDLRPSNRLFLVPRFADFLDFRTRRRDKLMTPDARLHRWNHRGFPASSAAMTILTVHLVLPGMNLMTERDRLPRFQFVSFTS